MTNTSNPSNLTGGTATGQLKQPKYDLTPSQVVGMIKIKGDTLRNLSRQNGLGADSLRNALYRHCPKYEKIIADFLGKTPAQIWPSRYSK